MKLAWIVALNLVAFSSQCRSQSLFDTIRDHVQTNRLITADPSQSVANDSRFAQGATLVTAGIRFDDEPSKEIYLRILDLRALELADLDTYRFDGPRDPTSKYYAIVVSAPYLVNEVDVISPGSHVRLVRVTEAGRVYYRGSEEFEILGVDSHAHGLRLYRLFTIFGGSSDLRSALISWRSDVARVPEYFGASPFRACADALDQSVATQPSIEPSPAPKPTFFQRLFGRSRS
jgi:hypothetical protein